MIIPLQAKLIAGALGLALAFGGGWTVRDWKADSDALEAKEDADKARDAAVKLAYDASASFEGERATIHVEAAEARSTIREIYRDVQVPADCAVPAAGVRLLDKAIEATGATASQPSAALPADPGASRPVHRSRTLGVGD